MTFSRALHVLFQVLAVVAVPSLSLAAATTYVASNGKNSNNCTRSAPCATLQKALNEVNANGEVQILTSGTFGDAAIDKSVTVTAEGVTATLGKVSIDRNGAVVALSGLHFNGRGALPTAIDIVRAAAVQIEDCTIERYSERAVIVPASAATRLSVARSVLRNNGISGITIFPPSSAAVTIDNSHFENNRTFGVSVGGGRTTINRTVISGARAPNSGGISVSGGTVNVSDSVSSNYFYGIFVSGGQLTLDSSTARGNDTGVFVGTTLRLSNSVITNNTTGIGGAGTVKTRGNSTVDGNNTNVAGTLTVQALGGI